MTRDIEPVFTLLINCSECGPSPCELHKPGPRPAPTGNLGETLRRLRAKAGMTMGDVARGLGVSVTEVSSVETGRLLWFYDRSIKEVGEFVGDDDGGLKGDIELMVDKVTAMFPAHFHHCGCLDYDLDPRDPIYCDDCKPLYRKWSLEVARESLRTSNPD